MFALVLALTTAISIENQQPGTPGWDLTNPALEREIEGYASATSVNHGETIELFVHTTAPRYTIEVFRTGWYGGVGARRVAGPLERDGIVQAMPPPDATTGLVECRWRDPYVLRTGTGGQPWPSGIYLAKLTASTGRQAFVVFVVRNDTSQSPLVFQSSVTTFAAFNNWGGRSLYAFNSGNAPARKVSFSRPYAMNPYGIRLDGAGDFLRRWEYNALRWLEREGYDVTYITDVDTHERAALVSDHRVFIAAGHDEYWSAAMREHIEEARGAGVSLVFLGADFGYWRIRFEPDVDGRPNRTIVAYKEAAGSEDPLALDRNPANDRFITGRWRDRPAMAPEERLVGVMYAADPVDGDIVVHNASHWAFAGTGLKNGEALRGLLGNVVDTSYGGGPETLELLAHSPFGDPADRRFGDMTIYTAASGALVFAAGSTQWAWGLDAYNAPEWRPDRTNASAQRITKNVVDHMLAGEKAEPSGTDGRRHNRTEIVGTGIEIAAVLIAAAFVIRAWRRAKTTGARTDRVQ